MPLTVEDLRFNPPTFDQKVLGEAAADLFGVEGDLRPLVGERDQNMLVTTAGDERFVLKVSGPLEDTAVTESQTRECNNQVRRVSL